MTHHRRGFTLIELLIVVVIIGILAAIAIPKFANTKEKATLAAMKSDLRNLVTEQEGFFADYKTYAAAYALPGTATAVGFGVSLGSTLQIIGADQTGWSAEMSNPSLKGTYQKCGVYVGTGSPPNAAVTREGIPTCY